MSGAFVEPGGPQLPTGIVYETSESQRCPVMAILPARNARQVFFAIVHADDPHYPVNLTPDEAFELAPRLAAFARAQGVAQGPAPLAALVASLPTCSHTETLDNGEDLSPPCGKLATWVMRGKFFDEHFCDDHVHEHGAPMKPLPWAAPAAALIATMKGDAST